MTDESESGIGMQQRARAAGDDCFRYAWNRLNSRAGPLIATDGLAAGLRLLLAFSHDNGFVRDDLSQLRRYALVDPSAPNRTFYAQYNPRRALRSGGAGRIHAPGGRASVHDGCFLCRDNVQWMQGGIELGIDFDVGDLRMTALPQPFPFAPDHVILASASHVAQRADAAGVLPVVAAIARLLPESIVLYNGPGAGATIPAHFHLQAFARGIEPRYPIERALDETSPGGAVYRVRNYPLAVLAVDLRDAAAIELAIERMSAWAQVFGPAASLNAIAIEGKTLIVVPRDRSRTWVPGLAGSIAGLEVIGEFVLSSEDELRRLERGEVNYEAVHRALMSISVPAFGEAAELRGD